MSYRELPPIEPNTTVEPNTGKEDKVELTIGNWFLLDATQEQVVSFANTLSNGSIITNTDTGGRHRVNLFNAPRIANWVSVAFKALQLANAPNNQPLVQGRIQVHPAMANTRSRLVSARLKINPTRLAEQLSGRDVVFGVGEGRSIRIPLTRTHGLDLIDDEFVLMNSDNVVMGERKLRALTPNRWAQLLHSAIVGIDELLSNSIDQAASRSGVLVSRERYYSLYKIETYWEFQHADDIAGIHELRPRFFGLGGSAQLSSYAISGPATARLEMECNAPSLSVKLRGDVRLKAYAKTNRGIRFEVEQKRGRDRHTTNTLAGIVQLMQSASERASEYVNRALAHLLPAELNNIESEPPHALFLAILAATDDIVLQRILASSLILSNSISNVRGNGPLRDAIGRLRQRGVISNSGPNSRTYSLAPQYQAARMALEDVFESMFPDDQGFGEPG